MEMLCIPVRKQIKYHNDFIRGEALIAYHWFIHTLNAFIIFGFAPYLWRKLSLVNRIEKETNTGKGD